MAHRIPGARESFASRVINRAPRFSARAMYAASWLLTFAPSSHTGSATSAKGQNLIGARIAPPKAVSAAAAGSRSALRRRRRILAVSTRRCSGACSVEPRRRSAIDAEPSGSSHSDTRTDASITRVVTGGRRADPEEPHRHSQHRTEDPQPIENRRQPAMPSPPHPRVDHQAVPRHPGLSDLWS